MARLRLATVVAHVALALATSGTILTGEVAWSRRAALLAVMLTPLLAALPGLLAGRRYTYRWLALLLVAYVGGAIVEVFATPDRLGFASLALFSALFELALLLVLIRRKPAAPRESAAP